MCSIALPEVADLDRLSPRELAHTLAELDGVRRRVDAMIAETVGVAERTAAYAEDGHASVSGWVKATCNRSSGDTTGVVRYARLSHASPKARSAAHAGHIGVASPTAVARVRQPALC